MSLLRSAWVQTTYHTFICYEVGLEVILEYNNGPFVTDLVTIVGGREHSNALATMINLITCWIMRRG